MQENRSQVWLSFVLVCVAIFLLVFLIVTIFPDWSNFLFGYSLFVLIRMTFRDIQNTQTPEKIDWFTNIRISYRSGCIYIHTSVFNSS